MNKKKHSILYVDDEQSNLNVFYNTFRRKYNIFTATTPKEGIKIFKSEKIDLIISDQRMPDMTGVEFLKKAMAIHPLPYRILITAYTDFEALKDAVNEAKIFQYVQKPWVEEKVQEVIDNALEIAYLKRKNIELLNLLEEKNNELKKINTDLVEIDQIKTQFLQIISHEIRTPLNGLVGATSLLKTSVNQDYDDQSGTYIDMLESSVLMLEQFLLKAEKITQLKTGKYKIVPKEVNLNFLISSIVDTLQSKANSKDIRIVFDNSNHQIINADVELIELSISELIINAINHSEVNSEIKIIAKFENNEASVKVIDNGDGFPDYILNRLSYPFTTNYDITKQGTGLSLALIYLIMDAHEGKLNAKNNNCSQGACVELSIPTKNIT